MHRQAPIGRDELLRALTATVVDGRAPLITLHGPPGVGKSHLVRHAMPLLAEALGAASAFVELGGATTLDEAMLRIAHALPADDSDAALDEVLAARSPLLLVLDGAERCAQALAAPLGAWLEGIEGLRVVVTSRRRLWARAEWCLPVEPLDEASATELFVAAARRSRAGWQHAPGEARTLRALVRALDGLPLALELAATRLDLFSLEELYSRLDQRFALLRARGDVAEAGPPSLYAALEASWEELDAPARAALAALSVCRGGCSLATFEALVAEPLAPCEPLELASTLVEHALAQSIAPPGAPTARRLVLLESVRLFVDARLEAPERAQWHARHTRCFLALLEQLGAEVPTLRATRAQTFLRVGQELDNLLAVHRRVSRLGDRAEADRIGSALRALLRAHGTSASTLSVLAPIAGAAEARRLEAELAEQRAERHRRAGALDAALAELHEAQSQLGGLSDDQEPRLRWRILRGLASVLGRLGEATAARDHDERALRLAEQAGDPALQCQSLEALARRLLREEDAGAAVSLLERALRLAEAEAEPEALQRILLQLAAASRQRGEVARARSLLERGLALDGGDPRLRHMLASSLAGHEPPHGAVRETPLHDEAGASALRVDRQARSLVLPDGTALTVTRPLLRRLLRALVERRLEAPGSALDAEAMIAAGWSGESILPDAARTRLYAAIHALRKLGLSVVLITRDDGYLLDPEVELVVGSVGER